MAVQSKTTLLMESVAVLKQFLKYMDENIVQKAMKLKPLNKMVELHGLFPKFKNIKEDKEDIKPISPIPVFKPNTVPVKNNPLPLHHPLYHFPPSVNDKFIIGEDAIQNATQRI